MPKGLQLPNPRARLFVPYPALTPYNLPRRTEPLTFFNSRRTPSLLSSRDPGLSDVWFKSLTVVKGSSLGIACDVQGLLHRRTAESLYESVCGLGLGLGWRQK